MTENTNTQEVPKSHLIVRDDAFDAKVSIMLDSHEQMIDRLEHHGRTTYSDSASAVHIKPFVQQVLSFMLMHKEPPLKFANGEFYQAVADIEPWAESFTWTSLENLTGPSGGVESAELFLKNFDADDAFKADVKLGTQVEQTYNGFAAFEFSEADVIKSARGNVNIARQKGVAARRFHDQNIDRWLSIGNVNRGVRGLLNAPDLPIEINGIGPWVDATPVDLKEEINRIITKVNNDSEETLEVDSVIMPIVEFAHIRTTQLDPAGGSLTILDHLKTENPGITLWDQTKKLDPLTDGGYTGVSALFYNRSLDHVSGHTGQMFVPAPIFQRVYKTLQVFRTIIGPTTVYQPKSFLRIDDIRT